MNNTSTGAMRPALIDGLAIALLLCGLSFAASQQGWFWRLDHTLYDAALGAWQRPAPEDVVVVAIDEDSLARLGRWPWSRTVHAALLDRLTAGEARAVGLDLILAEPESDAADAALAQAMRRNGKVVLPVAMEPAPGGGVRERPPLPPLAGTAAALGHIGLEIDPDGIARSVYLKEGLGAPRWPHLAVALFQVGGTAIAELPGLRNPDPPSEPDAWIRDHWLHIPYAGPPGHIRQVAYADVLDGKVPADFFRDKFVYVGASAAGLGDAYATPVSGHGRTMPGVEINAHVLDALRHGYDIRPLPGLAQASLSASLVLLTLLGYLRLRPRHALLLMLTALALTLAGTLLLSRFGQLWFAPASAALGILFTYPLWSWRRLEAAQRHLDEELGQLGKVPALLPRIEETAPGGDPIEQRFHAVRNASRQLRDLHRFVSESVAALPEGMLVSDREGRVLIANAAAADYLQHPSAGELHGKPLAELLAALKGLPEHFNPLMSGARRIEVRHPDGCDLLLHFSPYHSAQGALAGVIVSLVDITPLKQTERKRDQMLRFLSHDIRSPQGSIISWLELYRMDPEPDLLAEVIEHVEANARRTIELSEGFIQLVRAEGQDESEFSTVSLDAVVDAALKEVWPQAQRKRIGIRRGESPAGAQVRGDQGTLRRALVNLLSNAVKYSPEDTAVRLDLTRGNEVWRCCVTDQGYGIPPEDMKRLFEPFQRFHTQGNPETAGIGLGLAFVKAVAERHHGRVKVESEVGKGTQFCLELPIQPEGV